MNKGQLRIPDYLEHMLEAIRRIHRYTKGMDEATFRVDERTQDAVIRNIEIIGEASSNISHVDERFVEQHPEVPWKVMRAMRNRVAHGYFEIDWEIVWRTITKDLPHLEQQLTELKQHLE